MFVVALGEYAAGVFSNEEDLARKIEVCCYHLFCGRDDNFCIGRLPGKNVMNAAGRFLSFLSILLNSKATNRILGAPVKHDTVEPASLLLSCNNLSRKMLRGHTLTLRDLAPTVKITHIFPEARLDLAYTSCIRT